MATNGVRGGRRMDGGSLEGRRKAQRVRDEVGEKGKQGLLRSPLHPQYPSLFRRIYKQVSREKFLGQEVKKKEG